MIRDNSTNGPGLDNRLPRKTGPVPRREYILHGHEGRGHRRFFKAERATGLPPRFDTLALVVCRCMGIMDRDYFEKLQYSCVVLFVDRKELCVLRGTPARELGR